MSNAERRETMTRRQRVRNAIEHRPVDRMPIDLGCHYSTGISAFAYYNLREYLGLSVDSVEVIDPGQFLARVDQDVMDRFHLDAIVLHPGYPNTHRWNPRGKYRFTVPRNLNPRLQPDGGWHNYAEGREHNRAVMPAGGFFFDGGDVDMWELSPDEWWALFAREAERIHKETDYFTMMCGFAGYFADMEGCCQMYTDPDEFKAGNERLLNSQIERFDRMNRMMPGWVDAIELNGDLGTQNAPYVGADVYSDCTVPYLKRFCDHVHNTSDVKTYMHCCGSMQPLIPGLIEGGVDVINPVQISADNMDPNELKQRYGSRIAFWGGGCNTQTVLNLRGPEDVRENVRYLTGILAKDSGFIFNQVHNIMGDIRPENIVAMLDTAYELSFDYGTAQEK